MRQLSFSVSFANDNITEDAETFSARLTLDPADQARLGSRVRVSPDVVTVTIQDSGGKHFIALSSKHLHIPAVKMTDTDRIGPAVYCHM